MKKVLATLLIVLLSVSAVFAQGGAEKAEAKDPVLAAIEKAQTMTLQELEAAAEAEFKAANVTFAARGVTSGLKKVLASFQEAYPWFQYEKFSSSKDNALYTELTTALGQDQYVADIAMVQDGSSLKTELIDTGYVYNYVPKSFDIEPSDANPLTALYVNKNIFWNISGDIDKSYLQNVWQLTGADGVALKGVKQLSFQNPSNEKVNMSFLIMLTSPEACDRLAKAYKSYFGKEYAGGDGYKNIGYKYITEFVKNVTTWHSSDTTAVKNMVSMTTGQVVYGPLNKVKNYPSTNDYHKDLAISGWNTTLEGFDAYFYKMWIMIPKTTRLPYTTCLFLEYFFTPEGFTSGWSSEGYYSINPAVPVCEGDHTLKEWKSNSIIEDIDYIDSVYKDASSYIRSIVTI